MLAVAAADFGKRCANSARQPHESLAAFGGNIRRRIIRVEELSLAVFVEGDEPGQAPRPFRMPCQRAMFGARELQPDLRFAQNKQSNHRAHYVKNEG